MGRLDGKIALITGTSGGQGRAAAILFAREGAKVAGCDLNVPGAAGALRMVRDAGGQMVSMAPVDLSQEAGATQWVNDAVAAFGGIDVLYNNASVPRMGPFASMPTADWNFTIRNELDIVYLVTRAAWQHLIARGGGSIINTSSIASVRGFAGFEQSAHGIAKANVGALTTNLVVEGAPHKIRLNTITPGPIMHPMMEPVLKDPGHALTRLVARIPLGRIGRPQDVASLALFLASDESSYITGANVVIDGGLTASD